MRRHTVFLATAFIAASAPAHAERLVTSLSTSRVLISSNFTGSQVVVFGTVDRPPRDANGEPPRYDVVVTVRGPKASIVTRRKERVLGLWMNVDSRRFVEAPSYLAVMANRSLPEIADAEVLRRARLGIDHTVLLQRIGPDFADSVANDPFRQAFVRLQTRRGTYRQDERGVTFLTATVFRAVVPMPANVPTGAYEVETNLLSAGVVAATDRTALTVDKVGFEQRVTNLARDHGLLYGLAVSGLALLTGWLASIIFRRD